MKSRKNVKRFPSGLLLLAMLVLATTIGVVADQQEVDNDIASAGNQNIVYLSAAPGATVNASAQIIITRSGGNHLSVGDPVSFVVTPSQTTLPGLYSVSPVSGSIPSPWATNGTVYAVGWSAISFTAPTTPGDYTYDVKWEETHDYGNKLTGAPAFVINLTVESAGVPDIAVEKAGPADAHEGNTITYDYTVTNTGDTVLYDVSLEDDMLGSITLLGLTDEDADSYDDDLAIDATATGTGSYTVPWFTAGPVENEATATATYGDTDVDDTDDWSVTILHNPAIEVTKSGPVPIGYFQSVDAHYTYLVTNTGDCSLIVTLTDDQTGSPVYVSGDTNGNGYLDPDDPATAESDAETWTYTADQLIECPADNYTMSEFVNTATAEGEDATGAIVDDQACWSVIIFQWQPRTIGYWGNWDNHWSDTCMSDLVARVNADSAYFDGLTSADVKSILLAADQTGKMTQAKARLLVRKQLLAAWLNVESYIGATDADENTCGSLDAGMYPGATVYLSAVTGAEALFGAATLTVEVILHAVDAGMGTWDQNQLLIAKDALDKMNNAESNGYYMFMDPDFDPAECP